MRITFLGSGDAFGSGGRSHTCFLVEGEETTFLIDFGASALPAVRRFGVEPNDVRLVLVSHLHGDHFGGLPFLLLDAQHISKRTAPLTIAGPPTTPERLTAAQETLFPGSSETEHRFALEVLELEPERPRELCGVTVTPFVVEHSSGAPPFALRVECEGKVIAYSGDTEWTPALISAARGADLFIAECYTIDQDLRFHTSWHSLRPHLDDIAARRVVLTHLGPQALESLDALDAETAEDGKVVELH